jgi:hypothetical protein
LIKKFFAKVISIVMTAALIIGMTGCGKEAADKPADKTDDKKPTDIPEKKVDEVFTEEEREKYVTLKDSDGNVYDLGEWKLLFVTGGLQVRNPNLTTLMKKLARSG